MRREGREYVSGLVKKVHELCPSFFVFLAKGLPFVCESLDRGQIQSTVDLHRRLKVLQGETSECHLHKHCDHLLSFLRIVPNAKNRRGHPKAHIVRTLNETS